MPRPAAFAECHPDERNFAHGLCRVCYDRTRPVTDHKESNRRWRLNNPERYKAHQRKYLYGITPETFDAMLASQQGVCAVCQEPLKSPHVDHNHACCSGKRSCGKCVRGLLCFRCNAILGLAQDNTIVLTSAVAYVTKACIDK